MLQLLIQRCDSFQLQNGTMMHFESGREATFTNGTKSPQLVCVGPRDLCSKYVELVIDCDLVISESSMFYWHCISPTIDEREAVLDPNVLCEKDKDSDDPREFHEESCWLSTKLCEDVVQYNNFHTKWTTAAIVFVAGTFILGILTVILWMIPDISILDIGTPKKGKIV